MNNNDGCSRRTAEKKRRGHARELLPNVISLRISDEEKTVLETLGNKMEKSTSELMREAMLRWLSRQRGKGSDPAAG
ncbi:CopG family transcriptional regulator [Geotalea uraniireducens]|uniref:CopG family transcriptional regulator n=1 Tax=Geotalea uraniireducens TaxID=351604 RepID=A0ABM8EM21_9BACT|nr:ribbon-helix-helix protein, CopG family [Geotalea uraniireducens]BDV43625.1 CopG family transcriptional regulator [Geotalea uraniireducens]